MNEADWFPLYLSFKLAFVTTAVLVTAAAPLAYFLTFLRFRGKAFCEAAVNLPLALPPTVLGFYLLTIMGPGGWLGRIWRWVTDTPLIFSFPALVLASLIYSLPFAVQPLKASFGKVDRKLIESADVLGLSPLAVFLRVVLPNSAGGLAASAMLVFVHTVGEFGVILMVGGSIPGRTKVASIAIYEAVEALQYHQAAFLSLILLPLSYGILLLVNLLAEKRGYGT